MLSRTSFFDPTLGKKGLKRTMPLWVTHFIIWVMAMPVMLANVIGDNYRHAEMLEISEYVYYTVFIGGSSSFDLVPAPHDKFHALSALCAEEGYSHDEVLYVGDDYLEGGNDHAVAVSDIAFVTVNDYTKLGERLEFLF